MANSYEILKQQIEDKRRRRAALLGKTTVSSQQTKQAGDRYQELQQQIAKKRQERQQIIQQAPQIRQQAQAQQSQQVALNFNQPQETKKNPTSFIDKVKNFLGINIQDQLDLSQLPQLDLQSQQDISRQTQINKITQQESGQSARLPTRIEEEYSNKQKLEQSQKRQEAINILQNQEIPSWKTEAEAVLKESTYNYAKFFYGDKWDILSEDEKNKIAEAIRTDNFKIPESERKRLAVENTLSQQIGGVSNFNVINEQLIQAKANLEMIDKLSSMDTDTQRNFWKIVDDAAQGTSDVSLPIIASYLDLSDSMIRAGIQIKEKNGEELSTGEKIFKQKQLNKQTWDEISPETLDYKIAEGLLNMVSTGIEFFAYGGLAEELTAEQTAKLSGNKFVKSLLSEEAGKTKTAALRKLLADTIVDTPKIATQIALTQATPLADAVARTDWTQDDSYKNFVKQLIKSEATHTIETGGEYVIGDTYKAVFDDASKLVFGKNGVNQAISSANAKIAADNGIKSVTGMGLDDFMKISGYDGYVFEVLEEFTQNIASGLVQEGKLELPSADEVAITMISMGLYTALLGGSNALGTKFAYDEIKKNEALKEEALSQFTSELQKVDKNITDEQAREMFDGVLEEYSIQEKGQEEIETEDEKEPAIIPEIQQEQTQVKTQEQEAAPTEQVTETTEIEPQEETKIVDRTTQEIKRKIDNNEYPIKGLDKNSDYPIKDAAEFSSLQDYADIVKYELEQGEIKDHVKEIIDKYKTNNNLENSTFNQIITDIWEKSRQVIDSNGKIDTQKLKSLLEKVEVLQKKQGEKPIKIEVDEAPSGVEIASKGVYATINKDQFDYLRQETKNIDFTSEDSPHLTPIEKLRKSDLKKVSLEEIRKLSPNLDRSLKNIHAKEKKTQLQNQRTPEYWTDKINKEYKNLSKEGKELLADTAAYMAEGMGLGVQTTLVSEDADSYDFTKRITTSNNAPWYQQWYEENQKKPNNAEIIELAYKSLVSDPEMTDSDRKVMRDFMSKGGAITSDVEGNIDRIARERIENIVSPDEYADIVASQGEEYVPFQKTVNLLKAYAPVGKGKVKYSRLESRMKNVLNNISNMDQEEIDSFNLHQYNQANNDEQIRKATAFVNNDPERALKVLQGEIEAPSGILNNAILVAYTSYANESANNGDYQAMMALGSLRATRLGQELQILSKIDPDNAASKVNEIYNIRVQEVQKDTGKNYRKEVSSVKREINKEMKKNTKSEWISFIESIKC